MSYLNLYNFYKDNSPAQKQKTKIQSTGKSSAYDSSEVLTLTNQVHIKQSYSFVTDVEGTEDQVYCATDDLCSKEADHVPVQFSVTISDQFSK